MIAVLHLIPASLLLLIPLRTGSPDICPLFLTRQNFWFILY